MTVQFEIGTSVILNGENIQFVGLAEGVRIKFLLTVPAMMRLTSSNGKLSRQEKFKIYDRHRERLHEVARRLFKRATPKAAFIKIDAMDV